jgi:hypothetical protein
VLAPTHLGGDQKRAVSSATEWPAGRRITSHDPPTRHWDRSAGGGAGHWGRSATSTPPFDNEDTLVNTLLHVLTSALYRAPDVAANPGTADPAVMRASSVLNEAIISRP